MLSKTEYGWITNTQTHTTEINSHELSGIRTFMGFGPLKPYHRYDGQYGDGDVYVRRVRSIHKKKRQCDSNDRRVTKAKLAIRIPGERGVGSLVKAFEGRAHMRQWVLNGGPLRHQSLSRRAALHLSFLAFIRLMKLLKLY